MKENWKSFFLNLALCYASQSSCERLQVGAVIVKNKRVLSGGFNEAPSGLPFTMGQAICNALGNGCQKTLHAEENAIINAARYGVAIDGADMYCTHLPFQRCFGKVINAGIRRVFYKHEYRLDHAKEMAKLAGIMLERVKE